MSIEIQHLTHLYNEKTPFEKRALDDLSIEIGDGEFFGIIGHTGSGKSTLVQYFNALLIPKYGTVRINGEDPTDRKVNKKLLRAGVGMVFQYPEYQLFAETVERDVAFGYRNFFTDKKHPADPAKLEAAVKDALTQVGLDFETYRHRSPFELSGGQKRRVAIAGTIVCKPKILVLDEPTAGLDPAGKKEVLAMLHALKEHWVETVVMISHDMDEVAANCTRVAVVRSGKILFCEPPETLFQRAEEIEALGLELPQTVRVARELNRSGFRLSETVFTAEALADESAEELCERGGDETC